MNEIDTDQLAAALADGASLRAQVIDVREPHEYAAGHVPGARSLPMDALVDRFGELDPTVPVYVVCASGNRSAAMAKFLSERGLLAVNVAGGTSAWQRAGRLVELGASPVIVGPQR